MPTSWASSNHRWESRDTHPKKKKSKRSARSAWPWKTEKVAVEMSVKMSFKMFQMSSPQINPASCILKRSKTNKTNRSKASDSKTAEFRKEQFKSLPSNYLMKNPRSELLRWSNLSLLEDKVRSAYISFFKKSRARLVSTSDNAVSQRIVSCIWGSATDRPNPNLGAGFSNQSNQASKQDLKTSSASTQASGRSTFWFDEPEWLFLYKKSRVDSQPCGNSSHLWNLYYIYLHIT